MENLNFSCFKEAIQEKIRKQILDWGDKNGRDFPWRNTSDIYKILIAEIFLHRTRADQVTNIYENFINKYPDFKSILNTPETAILEELKSLGLPKRVNMLHKLSEVVINKFDGNIPTKKETLMTLPGVGNYIASAVVCFGLNIPEPVLDTNTVRILGRIYGIKIIDSSRRSKKFENLMHDFTGFDNARKISMFMLDLGAKICFPKNPRCDVCPIVDFCDYAWKNRGDLNAK